MNPVDVAQKLITYETITPREEGIYDYIRSLLPDFVALRADKEGVKNLFLYKDFGGANPLHFCFAGHVDVVPVGEGWSIAPFSGKILDRFLYGRGAQDMKGGIAAFICALKEFCAHVAPNTPLILSILLTSDEEGPAKFGTKHALKVLQEKNLLPHFALVAEPTCVRELGDSVKIGRRGSIAGRLTIHGVPGHVAYPRTCLNPIQVIADKLNLIAGAFLDDGDTDFEPSRLIITSIQSHSSAENVTPKTLDIIFNVRNSPITTLKSLENFLEVVLAKVPHNLHLKQNSAPFLSSKDSLLVACLEQAITEVLQITPTLNTNGGTSDARFLHAFGVEVVEFGLTGERIHSIDECLEIKQLENLTQVLLRLLQLISQKNGSKA
ncbi:Succinyl-diaminopimelate desuccinylase DapE [Helicobacter ailurogastricus]|uniref:Succinyl-diaminopimelate desuccinylase n=1 Tax=Helicobacter ailurogastricus TaxID=1578720 RepID=A0A0K2XXV8_9HELI|nr:succinyl-diaminopimelate desuccinylase [Helicobacter ailurogastricus]BDQ29089.1 succinyl-diaminopimelate desuccinylase [Helicobacter ailurogastricus]GMB89614.1 Succinyl-diaminopimelate desuccinylase DapE [Helicobacter ailurogastricus]GMB91139.1 Succinyl-diaminopimelate desuccinylase DapE [Helicobacter ailurogastricus]CRF51976.1 N-succinyl-L,L-diaminopimelate desuccinylase [Helicobacter ailurogastricus]